MNYYPILEPGNFYHIYNRGNNREQIFFNEANYHFFLKLYFAYLSPLLDTYAYCLLPNHFHLLGRVKDERALLRRLPAEHRHAPEIYISNQFRIFLMRYAKAINKQESRIGSLFQKNFKRKLIADEQYLATAIYYIHNNPVHHQLTNDLFSYKWSSFQALLHEDDRLKCDEVLAFFGGKEAYMQFHFGTEPAQEEFRQPVIEMI